MLEELEAVVEGLCSTEADALADPGAMVVLQRCLTRMEAAVTRATGAFDTSGAWASTGSRGAAMWLSVHTGLPTPVARRQVRLARALRQLGRRLSRLVALSRLATAAVAVSRGRTSVAALRQSAHSGPCGPHQRPRAADALGARHK